jgi:hypothetical protein
MLESKYRQTTEKLEIIVNQFNEMEIKKNSLEDNHQKMKHSYKKLNNEYLDLKFEL